MKQKLQNFLNSGDYILFKEISTLYKSFYDKKGPHRLDGPAIESRGGSKEWWVDGKIHRLDGPACEYKNSSKAWYVDGKLQDTENYPEAVKQYLLKLNKNTNQARI